MTMGGWFYVNPTCQLFCELCLKPGTSDLSALPLSGALCWLNWTLSNMTVVHSWLVGMKALGTGSVGQVAPRYFTNCFPYPLSWGKVMLCAVRTQPGQGTPLWDHEGCDLLIRYQIRYHRDVTSEKVQDDLPAWGVCAHDSLTSPVTIDKPSSCLSFVKLDP